MSTSIEMKTVREVLKPIDSDAMEDGGAYLEYVRAAFGHRTIGELTSNIEEIRPIGCFNEHELTGASYLECPLRPKNSLCVHQCESAHIRNHKDENEIYVRREQQIHVTGLLRAGLYVLQALGLSQDSPEQTSVHRQLQANAQGLEVLDHPSFVEFDRFRQESFLRVGGPSLDDRVMERLPEFMATETLPALKSAVNVAKMKWKDPMEESKDAVLTPLRALLGRV